jgi:hypothetical protein
MTLGKTKVPALITHAGCAAVRKVIGGNFRRVLETIWGQA